MIETRDLRRWWQSLDEEPEPFEPGEKLAAWLVTIAVALTRILAIAKTPWDWDEALFMSALRTYDVTAHHPHPPGFPLFIATAKLLTLAGLTDFRSLQAISLVASVAIVPAMLFLGRELRTGFRPALISGVFLAFFPNVWLFGGTAFSDVPSMTIVVVAIALLLKGCRSDAALYGGAIVLAVAAGYRPQNLLIGFVPSMIVAVRCVPRRLAQLTVAIVLGAAVIVASYGVAAHLSGGLPSYREAVQAHQHYISTIDSFRNPRRPALYRVFDKFFIRPYRLPAANIFVALLVAVGVGVSAVRVRAPALVTLATFGPFCVVAWLVLDWLSVSRFSIGYAPLIAILAADGLHTACARWPRAEAATTVLFAIAISVWMWPPLQEVRQHPSPPAAAAAWIRQHSNPVRSTLFAHDSMQPLIQGLLPGFPCVSTGESTPPVTAATRADDVFTTEGASTAAGALVFRRPRGRLIALVRDRYFEVSILHLQEIITFVDGWYDEEGIAGSMWRWMGRRARCQLPQLKGTGRLRLKLYVPLDALHVAPTITLRVNGVLVDRMSATRSNVQRTVDVVSRADAPNELVLETDRVVNPAAQGLGGDTRELGLRLEGISWSVAK